MFEDNITPTAPPHPQCAFNKKKKKKKKKKQTSLSSSLRWDDEPTVSNTQRRWGRCCVGGR